MPRRAEYFIWFLAGLLLCPAAGPAEENSTKIGVILPLSGKLAAFGDKVRKGVELAASEQKGKFTVIFEDSAYSSAQAISAFQKLTAVDQIRHIIGPAGPSETLAVAPLAQKLGVQLIAISLCDSRYAEYSDLFCTYPSLGEQVAPLFARFGGKNKLVSKLAILVEESEIGNGYFELVSEFARRSQIEVVFAQKFSGGSADFRSYLTPLRSKMPDLLIVSTSHPGNALQCLRQAAEVGIHPKYRWYLSEQDQELFAKHKDVLEGVYMEAIPQELNPIFVSKFQKEYGLQPDLYHALGYDATKGLLLALQAIPSGRVSDVTAYLIQHKLQGSAICGFDYKEDRSVTMAMVPSRFINGKQTKIDSPADLPASGGM